MRLPVSRDASIKEVFNLDHAPGYQNFAKQMGGLMQQHGKLGNAEGGKISGPQAEKLPTGWGEWSELVFGS